MGSINSILWVWWFCGFANWKIVCCMLTLNNEQRGEKKKKEERGGGRKKLTILSFFLGGGIQNVMVVLSCSTMHARRLLVGVFIVSLKVKKVFKTHTHTNTNLHTHTNTNLLGGGITNSTHIFEFQVSYQSTERNWGGKQEEIHWFVIAVAFASRNGCRGESENTAQKAHEDEYTTPQLVLIHVHESESKFK